MISLDKCKELISMRGCPSCGKETDNQMHSFGTIFSEDGGYIENRSSRMLIQLNCKYKSETTAFNPTDLENDLYGISELEKIFAQHYSRTT